MATTKRNTTNSTARKNSTKSGKSNDRFGITGAKGISFTPPKKKK